MLSGSKQQKNILSLFWRLRVWSRLHQAEMKVLTSQRSLLRFGGERAALFFQLLDAAGVLWLGATSLQSVSFVKILLFGLPCVPLMRVLWAVSRDHLDHLSVLRSLAWPLQWSHLLPYKVIYLLVPGMRTWLPFISGVGAGGAFGRSHHSCRNPWVSRTSPTHVSIESLFTCLQESRVTPLFVL